MTEPATIVLGLGATGYSCVRHLCGAARPRPVFAVDTRPAPPRAEAVRTRFPEVAVVAPGDFERALANADRVVVSPGIPLDHCLVRKARAANLAVTSDIELFLAAATAPVVGITGTNGKSTVTALVGELLQAAGLDAPTGGNLGTPALDLLAPGVDAYVLELSSFQLERLANPGLAAAAVLNVTPDHQDRHRSLADYAAAKRRIYRGARAAVFNADDALTVPDSGFAGRTVALNGDAAWRADAGAVVIDGERIPAADIALAGAHNCFNALAAAALARQVADVPVATVRAVLRQALGGGLPHRTAVVAEIGGVTYIDDSKATNAGAAAAALAGLGDGRQNIVLIAGGDAKGATFEALGDVVESHVSRVVLLGRDAEVLARSIADRAPTSWAKDMRHAVGLAAQHAEAGQTVLLSPACASFDMYESYAARGDDFAAAVRALPGAPDARAGRRDGEPS